MFRTLTCLTTEHDWRLVVVAGTVCFLASLTAVCVFHRARATTGWVQATWIIAAGASSGCGIWATHFIAILAYEPGVPMAHNIGLTTLSLLAAATITAFGLGVAASSSNVVGGCGRRRDRGGGGGVHALPRHMGGGKTGKVTWSLDLVLTSIAIGMLLGMAALVLATRRKDAASAIFAALFLTLAIVSHHFTAMGAVAIVPDPTRVISASALAPTSLAVAIAGIAVAVLGVSLAVAFIDDRRQRNLVVATALNNMSQGLCMYDGAEQLVMCNERYIQIYGLSTNVLKPGCSFRAVLDQRTLLGNLPVRATPGHGPR